MTMWEKVREENLNMVLAELLAESGLKATKFNRLFLCKFVLMGKFHVLDFGLYK